MTTCELLAKHCLVFTIYGGLGLLLSRVTIVTELLHLTYFQHSPERMTKKIGRSVKIQPLVKNSSYDTIWSKLDKILKQWMKPYQYRNQWKFQVFNAFIWIKKTGNKHLKNISPFRPFLGISYQNSAAYLSGRLHCSSVPFELCGRRIGQLGKFHKSSEDVKLVVVNQFIIENNHSMNII